MADRVSSAHPSVETYRATVERVGGTSRPRIRLPTAAGESVPTGVVRLDLDGTLKHADVRSGREAEGPAIHGVYDTPRLARSSDERKNRLPTWLADAGVDIGHSILLDVVVPGFLLGLREPGSTRVYEAIDPPASSLSDLAEGLDG